MEIVIASGKGGTGKTFFATNLARVYRENLSENLTLLDCDVEEPNVHLFFPGQTLEKEKVELLAPTEIDQAKCTSCGKCVDNCAYNALALVKGKVLIFNELCHVCGACSYICPTGAILEGKREIGELFHSRGKINLHYATLTCGEGGMTPRLIKKVRAQGGAGINILDASPGTACPAVETIKNTDLCILVTDPTPFGLHDLQLAANMCRKLGKEPVVIVNRACYRDSKLVEYCRRSSLEIIGEIPDSREIARAYSNGEMIVEKNPRYFELFSQLGEKILKIAPLNRPAKKPEEETIFPQGEERAITSRVNSVPQRNNHKPAELVVISGKGGTGKTSLLAAFAALAQKTIAADCDVDASNLPLLLPPETQEWGLFSGGHFAEINQEKCQKCGACQAFCRFNSISFKENTYWIDPLECEGCGLCYLVCPHDSIELQEAINGKWFVSKIKFGKMAHAWLGLAEENSGRLVTLTRKKAARLATSDQFREVLIDGSPGTGCPVIASLTGSSYALLVTEPTLSGFHDLKRIVDLTHFFNIKAGVVINKWDINQGIAEKIEKYSLEQELDFLGKISYDDSITEAQVARQTVIEFAPYSKIAGEIKELWQKLLCILQKD